jgi:hypothetical protein
MLVRRQGLEVHTKRPNHMLLFQYKNAQKNCDIKIGNGFFGNVAPFRCLGTTVTNANLI